MGKTETNKIEWYFEWYLNELKDFGYVKSWDREVETYEIFPKFKSNRLKYHKSKLPTEESFNLLQGSSYTYDYRIIWNDTAKYIFYNPTKFDFSNDIPLIVYPDTFFIAQQENINGKEEWVSKVDVKPPSKAARFNGSISSFMTFPLNQKALMWIYRIYINKIIPIPMQGSGGALALFPNTFTPKRFFHTDGRTRTRNIKFRITTLQKYVGDRQNLIASLDQVTKSIRSKEIHQGKLF